MHASGGQRSHLFRRGTSAPRNDRPGVPHTTPGRRRLTCNETDNRLLEFTPDVRRGVLLCRAPDLTDHDHGLSVRISGEEPQGVDEARADERISTDPDARRLA